MQHMEASGQLHDPTALPPVRKPPVHTGGCLTCSRRCGKQKSYNSCQESERLLLGSPARILVAILIVITGPKQQNKRRTKDKILNRTEA
jgi:hypothetical protein